MPRMGFGTFKIPADQTEVAVADALAAGYRLIDTAQAYGNERGVGRAIAGSGVPRAEIFVTTKVSNDAHGRQDAYDSVMRSVDALGGVPLDLVLIHWPQPQLGLAQSTWEALLALQREGAVIDIGLSNFTGRHLEAILAANAGVPAVNQIECHPLHAQAAQRERHRKLGIVTECSSALARGGALLSEEVPASIAAEIGVTPAQVVLRWHLQHGLVPLVKSTNPGRMRENIGAWDMVLSEAAMSALDAMDRGERVGPDPDRFPQQERTGTMGGGGR